MKGFEILECDCTLNICYIVIGMEDKSKLVDALKLFMEKTITPALGDSHPSLNEWKYLSGILSTQPIDSSQIDFYLLMANKSGISEPKSATFSSQRPQHLYGAGLDKPTSGSYANDSSHSRFKSNISMKSSLDSRR